MTYPPLITAICISIKLHERVVKVSLHVKVPMGLIKAGSISLLRDVYMASRMHIFAQTMFRCHQSIHIGCHETETSLSLKVGIVRLVYPNQHKQFF